MLHNKYQSLVTTFPVQLHGEAVKTTRDCTNKRPSILHIGSGHLPIFFCLKQGGLSKCQVTYVQTTIITVMIHAYMYMHACVLFSILVSLI